MKTRALATPSAAGLAFGQSRLSRGAAIVLRAADRLAPALTARCAVHLFFTPVPTKLSSRHRVPPPWQLERLHTGREGFALLRLQRSLIPYHQVGRLETVHLFRLQF